MCPFEWAQPAFFVGVIEVAAALGPVRLHWVLCD